MLIFLYGMFAYGVSMATVVWLIAACFDLLPLGFEGAAVVRGTPATLVDLGLIALFAVQHTIMARRGFKAWWQRVIPPAAERSTYVLVSGAILVVIFAGWQPTDGGWIWYVEQPGLRLALWGLNVLGWVLLLIATFATNHFDLYGVRQAWLHLRGRDYEPPPFVEGWVYRICRHPLMLGVLVGVWATPQMSSDHFVLALGFSAYIVMGIWFEERDLVHQFGDRYLDYRRRVGALLPRWF
ncbi:MAG: isoprenylcysteine carboxylmethyltransferase family protein [Gammaproteobacteria bacterium]|nr:isoprenylcysteine carboxylmethyltransferase family protein [Gammaproteobacteria bacterium]